LIIKEGGFWELLDKRTEDRILEFVATSKEPSHSTEIAKALGINRITTIKYLSVLHSKGLVSFRNVGMAKVWTAIENPVLQAFDTNDLKNTTIQAFNSLADSVCVLDKEMNILWINKEMEKRHGKLSEIKGKNCFDVFHGEDEICRNCPALKTLESGKKNVLSIRKKDFDLEITTSPLKDQDGKLAAVIEIVRVLNKGGKKVFSQPKS
jgi:PAS domain S-box-containing protein